MELENEMRLPIRYITLRARKCLYEFVKEELCALRRGFTSIFPAKLHKVLTAKELTVVMGGEDDINLQDWMKHTAYRGISQVGIVFCC